MGAGLRRWQLAAAYNPVTRLFTPGAASTWLLLGLLAALAVALTVLSRGGRKPGDFLDACRCPSTGYMALMTVAAFLLFGAGVLGLLDGVQELALWRAEPEYHVLTYPASLLLCGGLCFPAGAALLLVGRGAYRSEMSPACPLLAVFPACVGLVLVFATHLAHGTDPVLMGYGFTLLAAALLMLSHYYMAGWFHDCCHPHRAIFCGLMGVALALTALPGENGRFTCVVLTALAVSSLAQTCALLRGVFGPPWPERLEGRMPPGAEEEIEQDG